MPAPIVVFCYNRHHHLQQTLEALAKNELADQSDLYIYSDGPKAGQEDAVDAVRKYLKTVQGFKSVNIIERPQNFGLGKSIIEGVSSMVEQFGRVIVLEDDLVSSPYFLRFLNEGIERFEKNEQVASIVGYSYPIDHDKSCYFLNNSDCLGWATWTKSWQNFQENGQLLLDQLIAQKASKRFNFDNQYNYLGMLKNQLAGKNNSWAVRWYASNFLLNKLTLFPAKSLIQHIGNDGSGTNFVYKSDFLNVQLAQQAVEIPDDIVVEEDELARKKVGKYLGGSRSWKRRLHYWLQALFS